VRCYWELFGGTIKGTWGSPLGTSLEHIGKMKGTREKKAKKKKKKIQTPLPSKPEREKKKKT
jgi:hypothetical protein